MQAKNLFYVILKRSCLLTHNSSSFTVSQISSEL